MLSDALQQIIEDQSIDFEIVNVCVLGLKDLRRIRNIFKSAPLVQTVDFSGDVEFADFAAELTKLDDDELLLLLNLSSCSDEMEERLESILARRSLELTIGEEELATTTSIPLSNFAILAVEDNSNSIPRSLKRHFSFKIDFSIAELDQSRIDDEVMLTDMEEEQELSASKSQDARNGTYDLASISFAQIQLDENFDPNLQQMSEQVYVVTDAENGERYYYHSDFDGNSELLDSLEDFIESHWVSDLQDANEASPPSSMLAAMVNAVLSNSESEFLDEYGSGLIEFDEKSKDEMSAHLGKFAILCSQSNVRAVVLSENGSITPADGSEPIDICKFIDDGIASNSPHRTTLLDQTFN